MKKTSVQYVNSKTAESVNTEEHARLLALLEDADFCRRLTEIVFSTNILPS